MAQPYVGEVRLFAGNFAPAGWMFCNGALLPISENEVLFQLIGTTYGGDGQSTFGLPDLRGRVPIHQGAGAGLSSYTLGEMGGVESVTLTANQMPAHTHAVGASTAPGHLASPAGAVPAKHRDYKAFRSAGPGSAMHAQSVVSAGGSQPHDNMPPFQCVSYIISLFGIFPSPP